MDYEKAAAQIRNGPGDLPLVTTVLAELLEDLVPKSKKDATAKAEEDVVIEPKSDKPKSNK